MLLPLLNTSPLNQYLYFSVGLNTPLYPLSLANSFTGLFNLRNLTLTPGQAVRTIVKSYFQGEEEKHRYCRPCLLANFDQEQANLK